MFYLNSQALQEEIQAELGIQAGGRSRGRMGRRPGLGKPAAETAAQQTVCFSHRKVPLLDNFIIIANSHAP